MSVVLFLHIAAFAFWFGVVAVEFIIERQRARTREQGYVVARFHFWIDWFAEVPAITVLLITGLLMLDPARLHGVYLLKVSCGFLAICINYFSVVPVTLRKRAAEAGNHADVIRYSRWIDRTVPVGAPLALIALGVGVSWLL